MADGEIGLPATPAEALVSSGPGRFDISRKVFPAEGLRGSSTFGDSALLVRPNGNLEALCMEACRLIRQTIKENIEDKPTFSIGRSGCSFEFPLEESKQEP
jgi:hypothetical protein